MCAVKRSLYQFQLRIADGIGQDTAGGGWMPAFAGMTDSGNRQSINRIGITSLNSSLAACVEQDFLGRATGEGRTYPG